jgi:carboxymethylenebutenolidase
MSSPADENAVRTFGAAGHPPVLPLHPWWGITPAVTEWAADLAGVGRRVLVPDLYGGRTVATIEEAEALSEATLADHATFGFIQRCADELAAQEHPWAAMGFSLGGFLACSLAGGERPDPTS